MFFLICFLNSHHTYYNINIFPLAFLLCHSLVHNDYPFPLCHFFECLNEENIFLLTVKHVFTSDETTLKETTNQL